MTYFRILMKYQNLGGRLSGEVVPLLTGVVGNKGPQVMKYSNQEVYVERKRNLILRLEGSGIHHSQGIVTNLQFLY